MRIHGNYYKFSECGCGMDRRSNKPFDLVVIRNTVIGIQEFLGNFTEVRLERNQLPWWRLALFRCFWLGYVATLKNM